MSMRAMARGAVFAHRRAAPGASRRGTAAGTARARPSPARSEPLAAAILGPKGTKIGGGKRQRERTAKGPRPPRARGPEGHFWTLPDCGGGGRAGWPGGGSNLRVPRAALDRLLPVARLLLRKRGEVRPADRLWERQRAGFGAVGGRCNTHNTRGRQRTAKEKAVETHARRKAVTGILSNTHSLWHVSSL